MDGRSAEKYGVHLVPCQCMLTGRVLMLTQDQIDDAGGFDEDGYTPAARWLQRKIAEELAW